MFQAMFILYSLYTNEDTILMQLLIDGIFIANRVKFMTQIRRLLESTNQSILKSNNCPLTPRKLVANHVQYKCTCKKTSIKNGLKNNIYFNLLGSLFRYESTAFHSAVMLPAPKPVAPHRCMTSRKNVSLSNKGFVNTCIRYL